MSKRRAILVWSLVVLATLLTLVSSLTVWSKRQLLNTDKWTETSGDLLANDEVRSALSTKLVDLLYQRVDVTQQLESRLPKQAQGAAPVAAAALQTAATRAVDAFLSTPRAQDLWERINRRAHQGVVKVLEGKDVGPFGNANGDVVLDLRPLLERVATRLGIEDRLKANASPDTGEIVILKSDQLDAAQTGVKILKALTVFLVFVVLALYALAVYLARGRRRTILQASGAGLVFGGLLVLIVRRVVGNYVLDSVVKTDANKPAVRQIWLIGTDLLRDIAIALLVYGAVAILAGFLAGPSRPATWVRRTLAPAFRDHVVAVYGAVVLVFLVLLAWSPLNTDRGLLGTLVLAAVVLFGVEVWRRQTIREFPEGAAATKPAGGA